MTSSILEIRDVVGEDVARRLQLAQDRLAILERRERTRDAWRKHAEMSEDDSTQDAIGRDMAVMLGCTLDSIRDCTGPDGRGVE